MSLWLPQLFGKGVGRLLGSVLRYRRREVLESLRRSFPDMSGQERVAVASGTYRNLGLNIAEWCVFSRVDHEFVRKNVELENFERFTEAFNRGRGVIILTAHIGNFILMSAVAGLLNIPLHVITKRFKPEWLNRRYEKFSSRFGVSLLPRRGSYRACRRVLKNKQVLGFILDQNMKRSMGVFVDFFGVPACTSPGLAYLSANCQSPVLPAFSFRKADGTHKLVMMEPIEPPPDRKPETILAATQHYTAIIEQMVREHPDQWIWIHRRWRTRPDPDFAANQH